MEAQTCVRQLFPENRMEQKVRFLQKVDEQSLSMQNNAPSKLLSLLFKSQLISKGLFGVIVWTKKPTKFLRISALALRGRIKKIKAF